MFYPYDPLDGVKCSTNPRGQLYFWLECFGYLCKAFAELLLFMSLTCVYSRCLCDRDVLTAVTWWWQWKPRQGISLRDCVIYSIANCGFDNRQHGSHLPHSNAPPCVVRVTARVAGKGRRVCISATTGNDLDLFRENAPSVASARPVHWETRIPDAILFLVDTTLIWACTSWLA